MRFGVRDLSVCLGLFGALLGVVTGCDDARPDGATPPLSRGSAGEPLESVAAPASNPGVKVALSGETTAGSVTLVAPGRSRIYAKSSRTWIREKPERDARKLGYLRAGGSAPISGDAVRGPGCAGGWHPILPHGFICLNKWTTLDPKDPVVRVFLEHPPDATSKLPYVYGTVRKPGPVYLKLPSPEELRRAESSIDERMAEWLTIDGEIGASYAQHVWMHGSEAPDPAQAWEDKTTSGVPDVLLDGQMAPNLYQRPREEGTLTRGMMTAKVGHSFLTTFLWQGRRYGLSTELHLYPTDRLRPIQGSDFHGYEIGKDVKYPFALVRNVSARYRDGKRAEYRSAVQLTGKQQFFDGVLHYETTSGNWISDRYASRVKPPETLPGWAKQGERWIDVSLSRQVLTLYEGEEPVFVTLVSSGEAGLEDAETTTATKRGIFRIHTKHITATMSSREVGEEFELRDVPYVQYFDSGGLALHGAYWHDRFGMPKSHGCINLSPEDARRVFHWTKPDVPVGWHGALLPLRGTVIWIHN